MRPHADATARKRGASGNLERVAFPALLHHLHGLRATGTLEMKTSSGPAQGYVIERTGNKSYHVYGKLVPGQQVCVHGGAHPCRSLAGMPEPVARRQGARRYVEHPVGGGLVLPLPWHGKVAANGRRPCVAKLTRRFHGSREPEYLTATGNEHLDQLLADEARGSGHKHRRSPVA